MHHKIHYITNYATSIMESPCDSTGLMIKAPVPLSVNGKMLMDLT